MKQVLVRGGGVVVEEVPAPQVSARGILVRVAYSCVSVGTELNSVRLSGMPLYRRALKQPQHVARFVEVARDQGLKRTFDIVQGRLAAGLPTGYSAAGSVVAVGSEVAEFAVGDRVACAGAGLANHAEIIDVPVNLAVKVPDDLPLDLASTVTLGAIALQGIRRAAPTLGETVGVIGLGLIGQISVRLLRANGCHVVGVDVDPARVARALEGGMDYGIDPSKEDFVERVAKLTDGFGADAVIITAASTSNDIVHQALAACRKKARVVLVGDVGLKLDRADLYEKELDFLMATSYGPGRYDPEYEIEGRDYPVGYVRWTENRNLAEYLRLLREGRVSLDGLERETYDVDEAPAAYAALGRPGTKPLLVVLHYPEREAAGGRKVGIRAVTPKAGMIQVALIGAGSFAEAMHVPNLVALRDRFAIRCVMSRTGSDAKGVAVRAGAAYATTDYDEVLRDPEVDLVLITTRHDTHAPLVLRALEAGKHVFVEKPLALTSEELDAIETFYRGRQAPLLMTGFNRRFAPGIAAVRKVLADRTTPLIVDYQMNAGYLPPTHWVQGREGGGRNIGEACHIYDLFISLVGAPTGVRASAIAPTSKQWRRDDNFVATLDHADGSLCTLTYTSLGHRDHPKERMEVFADGKVLILDDYRSLTVRGGHHSGWRSTTVDKGHREELRALADTLRDGGSWPIPLEDQLGAMRVAFEVQREIGVADA